MQDFAEKFYKSKMWQKARNTYAKSVDGLCEECLKQGIYKPGDIVHHKIHITRENINDLDVILNPENFKLVCRECHGKEHSEQKRFKYDEDGNIIILKEPTI